MVFTNLEREFVLGDLQLYREFDNSHFISNAKSAITNKVQAVNLKMKFDYYSSMLVKAIENFNNINLDKSTIGEFLSNYNSYNKLDNMNYTMKDIDFTEVTTFKPQYINQYVNMVQTVIDKVMSDSIDETELVKYLTGELPAIVEKQAVKTTLRYGLTSKDLIKSEMPVVKADGTYIKTKVIPFVANFAIEKKTTLEEAGELLKVIKESESMIQAMFQAVENIKAKGDLDFSKIQKLNSISYNGLRGIIDVVSFVTFMMIRKMTNLTDKVFACESLYNDIMNYYSIESVTDDEIFATDDNSLGGELIDGKCGSFITLAQKIYDFNCGMPTASEIENVPVYTLRDASSLLSNTEKDNEPVVLTPYENIMKAFLSISSGLDVIAAEGDEYLMLFDDVMVKSGLGIDLKERYKGDLLAIDVLPHSDVDNTEANYKASLIELKSYGKNMEIIASLINEVYKKLQILLDRYNENSIAEYRDIESSNEMKIFLDGFVSNFRYFVNMVAAKFYNRLKEIGHVVSKISAVDNNSIDIPDNTDDLDFTEFAFDDMIKEFEEESDEYFKALEASYYIEHEKMLRGVNIVLEADQPANNQNQATDQNVQNTNQSNNQQSNNSNDKKNTGGVQIQDNSTETGKGSKVNSSGSLSKLKADLGEFINGIISKFTAMFTKNKNTYNTEYLNGRSYTNVSVTVPKYSTNFNETELKDPDTIAKFIKNLTPQALQAIPDKKTLYQKMFANTSISSIGFDENNSDAWKNAVLNSYKYGSQGKPGDTVQYANNDLKSFITQTALTFCDTISTDIGKKLSNLGNSVDEKIKSMGDGQDNGNNQNQSQNNNQAQPAPVKESVSIFLEDGEPAPNTEGSISTKVNWVREAVKLYCGILLNVLRDIGVDFTKILSALTPADQKKKN